MKNFSFTPPASYTTPHYRILASSPNDNEKDYAAVMSSKTYLRLWSDSPWPEEHFSLKENLEDLLAHHEEHLHGIAFGYNIHGLLGDSCHGSIYFNAVDFICRNYCSSEQDKSEILQHEVVITFWTSDALRNAGHHHEILAGILAWLKASWPFKNVLFLLRKNIDFDRPIFLACGLSPYKSLQNIEGGAIHLFSPKISKEVL